MSLDQRGAFSDVAASAARTQLNRVLELIRQGHTVESIQAWCEKEIQKREP